MKFTATQIAQLLNGTIEGDKNTVVNTFSKIEEGKQGSLCFLANPKYTHYIYETEASIVLVNNDFVAKGNIKSCIIRVEDSYKAIAILLDTYNKMTEKPSGIEKNSYIHKSVKKGKNIYVGAFAYISEGAVIGDNVQIYPNTFIGKNVKIGDNTVLYPGVKVYYNCEIGKDCIIHAGTVIGADGFGFAPNDGESFLKIAQIGNVVIEDDVELGALVTVDRATMGSTFIRKGVKLDNHNHIAHNCEIGENTVVAAQSGIAGTTVVGANCMFGGQVGIGPHLKIADETKLSAQSGVSNSIKTPDLLMGSPAIDIKNFHKSYIYFKNFEEIVNRIEELEKIINHRNENQ